MKAFKTISVQFVGQMSNNDKEYAFLTDLDVSVGDLVVVDTINGYKTANVTSIFGNEQKSTRWVVCMVDIEKFNEKLETLKRKQFIMNQMEQRLKEVDIMDRFALAAKTDDTMAKLLAAFNNDDVKTIDNKEFDK